MNHQDTKTPSVKTNVEHPTSNVQRPTKETPLLMCGPMVRSTLADIKTETRRGVKRNASGRVELRGKQWHIEDADVVKACPYGRVGDRLWVKETFAPLVDVDGGGWPSDRPVVDFRKAAPADCKLVADYIIFRADGEMEFCDEDGGMTERSFWKPSIFMWRWASRITLEVVDIGVERLQEISVASVLAEGVRLPCTKEGQLLERISGKFLPSSYLPVKPLKATTDQWLVAHYASLWESINGAGSWRQNPWVWVIKFKRLDPNVGLAIAK